MNRSAPRTALVALAALAALAATPSPARAVTSGSASVRRALTGTLAGDAHHHEGHDGAPRARRACPDPLPRSTGGRLALNVERQLARWGESAHRWAKERVALAVYVADVTGLSDLADRLTDETA